MMLLIAPTSLCIFNILVCMLIFLVTLIQYIANRSLTVIQRYLNRKMLIVFSTKTLPTMAHFLVVYVISLTLSRVLIFKTWMFFFFLAGVLLLAVHISLISFSLAKMK